MIVLRGDIIRAGGDVPVRMNRVTNVLAVSSFHLSPETLARYAEIIRDFRPDFIAAYPSSLAILCGLADERNVQLPQVKCVFTSSETLHRSSRDLIEATLGTRVFDYYGNAERTVAAGQCEEGMYHFSPWYSRLDSGLRGHHAVVSTPLWATGMPLLRYRTGDSALFAGQVCPCGRSGPIASAIAGRDEDVVLGENGRRVGRLDSIFKGIPGIARAQLLQDQPGELQIRIVPAGSFSPALLPVIEQRVRDRAGSIDVVFSLTSELERTAAGKTPFIISRAGAR